ncbi:hypothetical protein [uncultured Mediterranean phage uvMED]|nr:hypothetical protein [uncultured Mediterranean phage uvMED]
MAATDYRQYNNLISADEVAEMAMSHANMDSTIIDDNIILIAEITHLKEHLGDYFWGRLREKNHPPRTGNSNNHETLNDNELTLVDNYIKPCLAFYVKYEVLNDMQYNTTSAGIMINEDDWSESADAKEMGVLKDDTLRKANILRKDMMRWLLDSDNDNVFPDYDSSENDIHWDGDKVTRLGGILAYGNKTNLQQKNERYYS